MNESPASSQDLAAETGHSGTPDTTPQGAITQLLKRWAAGDAHALGELAPLVYDELKRLAARHLRHERDGHTLAPSGLVHEAYMRLSSEGAMQFQSRAQFFGLASRLMRHVLIDHARSRSAAKRGSGHVLPFDDLGDSALASLDPAAQSPTLDLLALDQALQRLERLDPQQCQVVELRFFGGLSVDETAAALEISAASVKREWVSARAWLLRQLAGQPAKPA
jgi:RNA polymerase sigma factor (TIGR02999 family)